MLVSTSVIEVGVDVARANVMVIMGARRFGLSQLHQLRGRVGRSGEQSYCFLMAEGEEGEVLERLALFARTPDGFDLAEADLRARGEGQLFGERQSGMGDLEVASLLRDRVLLEEARAEAKALLPGVWRRRRARRYTGCCSRPRSALRTEGRLDGPGMSGRAPGTVRIVAGAKRGRRLSCARGSRGPTDQRDGEGGGLRRARSGEWPEGA